MIHRKSLAHRSRAVDDGRAPDPGLAEIYSVQRTASPGPGGMPLALRLSKWLGSVNLPGSHSVIEQAFAHLLDDYAEPLSTPCLSSQRLCQGRVVVLLSLTGFRLIMPIHTPYRMTCYD